VEAEVEEAREGGKEKYDDEDGGASRQFSCKILRCKVGEKDYEGRETK